MRNLITFASALTLTLAFAAAQPLHAAAETEMAPSDQQLNKLYWQGQEDLKQSDWPSALKRFQDLEKQLRSKEPRNVDTALYWQAYTLMQAKRSTEAKAAADRLHREFPDSRWGKEVDTLLRPAKAVVAGADISNAGDEDLAAIAVEGLMNAPHERAFPLLKKVLQSQHSAHVKKRALFVLSQFGTSEALDLVLDAARNNADPELREEAIRMLGVSGDKAAIERLSELYAQSKDPHQQREIIHAWLIADRKDLVLKAARNEPNPEVRRAAVEALGAMGAEAELKQLFDASKDPQTQKAIVQSLGVAGDTATLAVIADSAASEQIRIEAMHALGVAGGHGGGEVLVKLYAKANTPALREAALHGLLITGDSESVLKLYRAAKTQEEKKSLLRTLTVMDNGAALELIEAELNK